MTGLAIDLPGPDATRALGTAVARSLRMGEAVCLWGPLGAGKTTLARGLIGALQRTPEEVPSPSFTLVQLYEGVEFPVAHFDLYRIQSLAEIEELGLDDAMDGGAAVIEWPERLEGRLPPERLDIVLSIVGEGRRAVLERHGAWRGRSIER